MSEGSSLIGGGQFTGPSPTPMGSGLSRVLGLQGGDLPGLAASPGSVVPVGIVFDTSEQLSRELQPRRFVSGRFDVLAAPNVLHWRFRAPTHASVVIERLELRGPASALLTGNIGVGTSPGEAFIGMAPFLTVGGVPTGGQVPGTGSVNFTGWGPQVNTNNPNLGFGSVIVPPWSFLGDTLIWLGPGASLALETGVAGEDVGWFIRWREIAE